MPTMEIYKHIEHEDNQRYGGISRLMRRVHSLEDLLKKLRWERSAVQAHPQAEQISHAYSQRDEGYVFRMPVHYPRFSKADYQSMPEWKLDHLFQEYGLIVKGDLEFKRNYAVGAFLWPDD